MASNKGISGVYSTSTEAVSTVFATVGTLASAGKLLAENAETQAMISRVESAKKLVEVIGKDGAKFLTDAASLMATLRNM